MFTVGDVTTQHTRSTVTLQHRLGALYITSHAATKSFAVLYDYILRWHQSPSDMKEQFEAKESDMKQQLVANQDRIRAPVI